MKTPLLFLAHRIPYPPHKGEKLRALNFLKRLAPSFDIHLGALIDAPQDLEHVHALDRWCVDTHFADITDRTKAAAGLKSVLLREPATYTMFRHGDLAAWARGVAAANPGLPVYAYSSGVAPYLSLPGRGRLVMDFVDVDSAKWTAMGAARLPPLRWIYGREGRLLAREESRLAREADHAVFVSKAEAAHFTARSGLPAQAIPNGVDVAYWTVGKALPSPYLGAAPRMILTGAMNYPPNVDAAIWFVRKVLPRIRAALPMAEFVIAGGAPTPAVQALAKTPGVRVTGYVADMRPWLAHADISVAPLLIARGVQNKVLEAMAAGTPCVASAAAMEGIQAKPSEHLAVADGEADFAKTALALLTDADARARMAQAAQTLASASFSWDAAADSLADLLRGGAKSQAAA